MEHQNIWGHNKFPNPVDQTETIVLFLRQDVSLLGRKLTIGFMLVLVGFFVKLQLQNASNMSDNSAWFYFVNMSYYAFVCLLMLKFAFFCHNYYLSFWAITPLRIICFRQNNFFQADVNSIWYKNVEKKELKSTKAANTLNNFGDIVLSMRGEGEQKPKITIANIPNPKLVLETIDVWLK
jgi:hypothetical protein